MEKITAGIIDKLNIIGFFNVILSGGVLLYGISPVLDQYAPGLFYMRLGLEKDLEIGIVLCLMCYILGCALQSIQEVLFRGFKADIIHRCLAGGDMAPEGQRKKPVLANEYKRKAYTALASKLFSDKKLGEFDPGDKEMCRYFVEYCEYSNSIKGYGGRAALLSESAGFFEQLASAFYTLVVIGILILILAGTREWLYCLGYLVLGGIFTGRAYQCRLNWVRTVLSTYEAVTDQEAPEKEKK